MNVERGCFLLRERAESFVGATCALELHVGGDDINKVDLLLDRIDGTLTNTGQLANVYKGES